MHFFLGTAFSGGWIHIVVDTNRGYLWYWSQSQLTQTTGWTHVETNLCLPLLLVNLLLPFETRESVGEVPVQVDAVFIKPETDRRRLADVRLGTQTLTRGVLIDIKHVPLVLVLTWLSISRYLSYLSNKQASRVYRRRETHSDIVHWSLG